MQVVVVFLRGAEPLSGILCSEHTPLLVHSFRKSELLLIFLPSLQPAGGRGMGVG